jgi:hypothetical protein
MIAMMQALVSVGLAVSLMSLGRYGWVNASRLVPGHLTGDRRVSKQRALRRGAVMCFVVGVTLTVVACGSAVQSALG